MNENKAAPIISLIKSKPLIPILLIVGVLLLIFGDELGGAAPKNAEDTAAVTEIKSYTEELERRAASLISNVAGVSDVKLLLTLDSGSEYIYAENTASESAEYLIINTADGEEPVLVREIYASVRGIAVVCGGGDDPQIRSTVTELLSCAFDIPLSKISVAGTGG